MKGTTLYGKPTGKGGFTKGDLTVSRTGNDNMADGRAKSSAFQKPGAPGVWDTVKKTAKKAGEKISSEAKAINAALFAKGSGDGNMAPGLFRHKDERFYRADPVGAYYEEKRNQRSKKEAAEGLKQKKIKNVATTKKGNMDAVKKMKANKTK